MSRSVRDEDFSREWNYHYLRSVHAAVSDVYERTAWCPADEVYLTLAEELERRAVEATAGFVYESAALISQGERPEILRAESGRHRFLGDPVGQDGPAGYTGRHVHRSGPECKTHVSSFVTSSALASWAVQAPGGPSQG